jgi:hypothetical protein
MKIPKGARVQTFVEVEPTALVEISETKTVRENLAVVFRGAARWSDEAAAHHRKLFPVTSAFYSIGCEGHYYHQSHAGSDGTSPWAFDHVMCELGLVGEPTYWAVTHGIGGRYDARKGSWVSRKGAFATEEEVATVSIGQLIEKLDRRIEELRLDPDLIEDYLNVAHSYQEGLDFDAAPFEVRMGRFRRVSSESRGENS